MPVVEFTVEGPPVSHQSKNQVALGAWKARVREAASAAWKEAPLQGLLKCTIMNFHKGDEPRIDGRNLVRPIRDAMIGVVYADDMRIRHSVYRQLSLSGKDGPHLMGRIIGQGRSTGGPFVFVRVEDAPDEFELPRETSCYSSPNPSPPKSPG
jgi:hypothetical protein